MIDFYFTFIIDNTSILSCIAKLITNNICCKYRSLNIGLPCIVEDTCSLKMNISIYREMGSHFCF